MTEERITLKFKESKLVWNRYVKYEDYDLMGNRVYVTAGNEANWLEYALGVQFTPDFYVMITNFDMISVSLYIKYADVAPVMRWSCSGAPLWKCSEDINGMFPDEASCKSACRGAPDCIPNMKCEEPRNGYENDGCGLRRANTKCDPIVSVPLQITAKPTTIKVGELIEISGKYRSNVQVEIYEDVLFGKTLATPTCNSAGEFKTNIYLNKPIGTYKIRAKYCALLACDYSNIITIWVIKADTPCVPIWRCKEPKDGYESDGCGNTAYNSLCLPEDPILPCADGNTRIVQCPNDPSKTYTEKCVAGKWVPVDRNKICGTDDNMYYILTLVVIIIVIMLLYTKLKRRK